VETNISHRRYYQIGGITIQVDSDLPITDNTFHPKFKLFQVDGNGKEKDTISIEHRFSLPDISGWDLGQEVYRRPPWAIYRNETSYVYMGISPTAGEKRYYMIVVFSHDHTRGLIYSDGMEIFRKGNLHSLTLFPTDQILLAQVLADRGGCYMHSSGVVLEGKGLLLAGRSGAGKSTLAMMLKERAKILCDDRVITRRWTEGFRIHGTWSHGDVPDVSPDSAPLRAIMFLEKASLNDLALIGNKKEVIKRLVACLVRPFVTKDWWEKMLALVEVVVKEIPCYVLKFDKTGKVVDVMADELNNLRRYS